ncbi:phenylalanine--tRNA ligase subunit beta [Marinicrinis lubricantis]|uniref:Phenylalanine--tRNA ligase beta subunit n=1 Tax=Marinicrinis lubricantis TaxID=2086470 RepID=A0ABW1ILJ2_9BACL
MKVSYEWLSQYIDLSGYTAEELAEKLTRSGIEVDIVEHRNKGISGVTVGYVKSKEKHPDADKLNVCTVDAGQGQDLQIVCGAKNVDAGQKVPVALIGAVLPGDFKIKKAKLRGVESQGMICSAKELGMNDKLLPKEQQEGILVLPEQTEIGQDILPVLGLSDAVMELDLTPNRSDCLSMIGTAYEIGAILGREVKLPDNDVPEQDVAASQYVKVKIDAPGQCTHYAARYVEEVKIGPSPLWLQNRLMGAGIRPINNVVDITNYVMLEYGQPLHAFDADKLDNGQIVVRQAEPGEQIVTLDGQTRSLDEEMLLITDGVKPIAIAGVMGGANSEVTEATTRIVLESAKFAGSSVRKTSRKLGLRSEASLRFEKEVDPAGVVPALNRAAQLLAAYASGQVAGGIVEEMKLAPEPVKIALSLERVNHYLGTEMSMDDLKEVFSRLQFAFEAEGTTLFITAPTRRGDITRDVDLIEEAARLYGYDHIPTTLMTGVTTPGSLTKDQKIRRLIRRQLTESGLHEVINYSFTHPEWINELPGAYSPSVPVQLAMPMSEERSVLRTSLIPHLLETAQYNRNRSLNDVAVFEIGTVFVSEEERISKLPEEKQLLAVLWTGNKQQAHWSGKSAKVDFYDLKGIAEQLFAYLGLGSLVRFAPSQFEGYHPGRTAEIQLHSGSEWIEIGRIGQLHPELQHRKDLDDTYAMEMELAQVYEMADTQISYRMLPKFPAMTRDIAVVVEDAVRVGDMLKEIEHHAGELLESLQVFDIFKGDRLGQGKKSVALSLVYRHHERTLTDDEVTAVHQKVVDRLEQSFGAELRK